MRRAMIAGAAALLGGMAPTPAAAQAETGMLLDSGAPGQSAALEAGALLLLENRDGPLSFAGHELGQQRFTGILGYASEVAYVIVIDGVVANGDDQVRPGQMLLIPPYGSAPVVQRYDAARLLPKWSDAARRSAPAIFASLQAIADRQRTGIRIGRFSRSSVNVSAPGGQASEVARRSLKSAQAVQGIRFSGETDMARIEAKVVERFLAGIASGDVETVAALIDPEPFGDTNLSGEPSAARRLLAESLIRQHDWKRLLAGTHPVRQADGNLWRIEGGDTPGVLLLRPVADFVFVRGIRLGEGA